MRFDRCNLGAEDLKRLWPTSGVTEISLNSGITRHAGASTPSVALDSSVDLAEHDAHLRDGGNDHVGMNVKSILSYLATSAGTTLSCSA